VRPATHRLDEVRRGSEHAGIRRAVREADWVQPNLLQETHKECRSPLRFPGGKSRAVTQILQFFPRTPGSLASPFVGGGSVELAAAHMGWRVHAYDAFKPLVGFWQTVLTNSEGLADKVMDYYPLPKETFYRLQQTHFATKLEEAARFFVLNRSSFNGSTMSGGMSPGHQRFTLSSIDRLRRFCVQNFWVKQADFRKSIAQSRNSFLYLDPPYWLATKLYGDRGNLHTGFDHVGLRECLRCRDQWILSYDDCPEVRAMYDGYRIVQLSWKYGMSTDKHGRELLVLSHDMATKL